jgi:hypothetical protein
MCQPCNIGGTGSQLSASGFLGRGPAERVTFDGVTYGPGTVSFADIWTSQVFVPFPLPATGTDGVFSVEGPFSWRGHAELGIFPDLKGLVVLMGSGTARLTFAPESTPGNIQIVSARYDFQGPAPTPEPASMLLLGSGLVLISSRSFQRSLKRLSRHP